MQLLTDTEQVRQTELQASQVLVALLAMVVPAGQALVQVLLAEGLRKKPVVQVMHAVWVVQVAQGLTHFVQVVGLTVVSG